MAEKLETTYYRFLSEVRAFLAKLIKEPIKAEPSKYLKDRGFNKTRLINVLIKSEILERHEKILDRTNSEEKTAKYVVKYRVRKKDFEKRIEKIYIKNFEKNLPDKEEKKQVNECDGGAVGGDGSGGATSTSSVGSETSRGDVGYDVLFGPMISRPGYLAARGKKKKGETKPEDILGKDISAEGKSPRKIYFTESQMKKILEEEMGGATTTATVGSLEVFKGTPIDFKTSDGKPDPTLTSIKVKQVMGNKPKNK